MTRKYIDWFFWIGILGGIGAILYFKPELLGLREWALVIWVVGALLLAPALYFSLARKIFPKAFPERIRIRPFTQLHDKTTYNGSAIAKLLELEMRPPTPSKEARSRVRSESHPQTLSIGVAGTTIPLEFIWGRVDHWVLGPIDTIEGIVSENNGSVSLEAWSTGREFNWRAASSSHPDSDPLRTAIRSLADMMRESFQHYKELADKYENQLRYRQAIFYCQQLDTTEQGLTPGFLYLAAGQLDEAESAFSALETDENKQEVRAEAVRGLALVTAARGKHAEAIELLNSVHAHLRVRSRLDEAAVHCYREDFNSARNILESLIPDIETKLQSILKVNRAGLSVDVLMLKAARLRESEWAELRDGLWQLAELWEIVGRCSDALHDVQRSKQSYHSALEALHQVSNFERDFHPTALQLAARLADLTLYDEAMEYYDECISGAKGQYREDPEDVLSLTNIAWAIAGNLACQVAKLKLRSELDTGKNAASLHEIFESARPLLAWFERIPEDAWQAMISEAVAHSGLTRITEAAIRSSDLPGEAQTDDCVRVIDRIKELIHTESDWDLSSLVHQTVMSIQNEQRAREYFSYLLQKQDTCHIAEAYFGLACIECICEQHENALQWLELAFKIAPQLRNRAGLDKDLRDLRGTKEFQRLMQWHSDLVN